MFNNPLVELVLSSKLSKIGNRQCWERLVRKVRVLITMLKMYLNTVRKCRFLKIPSSKYLSTFKYLLELENNRNPEINQQQF